ncbi:helix-turn-helix domain-containing protein [Streptomyces sp. C10]|uniref:helix-turn-helix domain-containing protein n=1 Tax=Streptomyces sp. C10 TaxID=531941 RepID=UPI003980AF4E
MTCDKRSLLLKPRLRAPLARIGRDDIDVTATALLQQLLRGYRELGNLSCTDGPRRVASQEQVARQAGMSQPWYAQLERGRRRGTVEQLERISQALRMTPRARIALFRRSAGHDPLPLGPDTATASATALWHEAMKVQPTCLTDVDFNVLAYNESFASCLPYALATDERPNVMQTLLLRSEPRTQLAHWRLWAELLTAELAEAAALYGRSEDLQSLHLQVVADETVGPLYRTAGSYLFPDTDCKAVLRESTVYPGVRQLTFIGLDQGDSQRALH